MKKGLIAIGIASSALLGVTFTSAYANASKQAVARNEAVSNDVKEDWQKFKDTYLVPLTALGISVPTVISCTMFVVNSVLKKKIQQKILDCDEKILACSKALEQVSDILLKVQSESEMTSKINATLSSTYKAIQEIIESNKTLSKKVESLKTVSKTLIEIESKLTQVSDSAVKAGIVQEVIKLQQMIKNL